MMVISAVNPSKEAMLRNDDNRIFLQKILMMLQEKCKWFGEHFSKLGVDLTAIRGQYKLKLGGQSAVFDNRKNKIK